MAQTDCTKKRNLDYVLVHGGTKVCRAFFLKRVNDLKPPEKAPEDWTVDKFLSRNKRAILRTQTGIDQRHRIFPGGTAVTNIEDWDISILVCVLKSAGQVDALTEYHLDGLRKMRNKLSHKSDISTLSDEKYVRYKRKLKALVEKLSEEVKDESLKKIITEMFEKVENGMIDDNELALAEQKLKETVQHNEETKHFVENEHKRTRQIVQKGNEETSTLLREILAAVKGQKGSEDITDVKICLQPRNCTSATEQILSGILVEAFSEEINPVQSKGESLTKRFCDDMLHGLDDEIENDSQLDGLGNDERHKVREAVRKVMLKLQDAGYIVLKAEQSCVLICIRCKSLVAALLLYEQYVEGGLDSYFDDLRETIQSIDMMEGLILETVAYSEDLLELLQNSELMVRSTSLDRSGNVKDDAVHGNVPTVLIPTTSASLTLTVRRIKEKILPQTDEGFIFKEAADDLDHLVHSIISREDVEEKRNKIATSKITMSNKPSESLVSPKSEKSEMIMMEYFLETFRYIIRDISKTALSSSKDESKLSSESGRSQSNEDLKNENLRLRRALKEIRRVVDETLQDRDRVTEIQNERPQQEHGPRTTTQSVAEDLASNLASLGQITEQLVPGHGPIIGNIGDSADEIDLQELLSEAQYERSHLHEDNDDVKHWRETAEKETKKIEKLKYLPGRVVTICLDVSESMRKGNAWQQAKQFLLQYFDGTEALWEQGSRYDFIAIVTFGGDVCVKAKPTQNLEDLRNTVENLTIGGLTPMFGSLVVARAIVSTPLSKVCVNDYLLRPQIILVTDGKPTELGRTDGIDVSEEENIQKTKTIVFDELQYFRNLDFHCVLVGNCSDKDFLTKVLEKSRNKPTKLLTYKDGSEMAWFSTNEIAKYGNKKYVNPVISDKKCKTISMLGTTVLNMFKECSTGKFREYPVGTRVRRGSDWNYGNQDSHGVGTIIGHDEEHSYGDYVRVWVEWDSGDRNIYVITSLSITNEDRVPPENETIAVGSAVKPGKDFKRQATDVTEAKQTGVVIRLKTDIQQAVVRWNNCTWGSYHFGKHGAPEEIEPVRIPELPFDFSDHILSERDLQMIADKVGKNWRALGVELGLTDVMLDQIAEDAITSVHRVATMLRRWKSMSDEQATLQNLLTILRRKAGVFNIAWDETERALLPGQIPQWYRKAKIARP